MNINDLVKYVCEHIEDIEDYTVGDPPSRHEAQQIMNDFLDDVKSHGEIIDYSVDYDDVTQEFILHYTVQPPPRRYFVIELIGAST
jgi:hypothetical protein